ncbi:hypothetical protein AALA79_18590 [Lachnospiraceae bacterium 64-25]|jgi:hypothetical protein|nr:hypothetical protein [Lachnospiraceae bacterium]
MENNIIFQKLTPTDTVKMEVYEEAFKYIFENADIKNVAIAGPYSAGKSSLLESYKKKHNNKKFLHISLAHFEDTSGQNDRDNVKDTETVLEGKILNQLIQQIKVENIPQTNFRVKRTVNNVKCVTFSLGTVIFLISILHLKYFKAWSGWIASLTDSCFKTLLQKSANPYSLIFSGILATVILGLGVYQIIKTQKNKNIFRKLSVQGNEIEIFGEEDNSYFDKYLNEVLYLFENAGVDVIVFEDLDRFDNNKIFERLREINILSNIRLQNRKEKMTVEPLRFFYLLRDDIFVNKDRTKFFDFILPVVPVLDSSNAYDQIKEHFETGGIFTIFDDKFLRGLSLYIDDMRVLKNIYNEFMVYYNKLNTIELNPNKMLAMVTYKNIFPRDFSDLQLNQGFVYELFNRKNEFIAQEKKKYEERIESKKARISYVKEEMLESILELDDVKNVKHERIPPRYNNYAQYTQKMQEYNEWVEKEYPLRKRAIEDKEKNRLHTLEDELSLLQEECRIIDNKVLHEVITRENIDEIFRITSQNEVGTVNEYKEIKSSEYFALLKYLIRYGYIDESYNDYMTFFYENSLTKGDKMFLRSVTDKIAKPFSYSIDNVSLVMENLDIYDFEQEETLNFDLFEYLLVNKSKQSILLCFIKQLRKGEKFQFISEFFETDRENVNLVVMINNQWSSFFKEVISGQKMPVKQIREYSIATLLYTKEADLSAVNDSNCLTDYISSQQDYLAIENPDVEKLCDVMKLLQVFFKHLDYQVSNRELFNAVYQNSLYEINIDNIRLMLETEYHIEDTDNVSKHYISSIYSQPEQPLYRYMQENADLFMESILDSPVDGFMDNSNDAVQIINHPAIAKEYKVAYIKKLETLIDMLANINDVMYQTELIAKQGVQYTVNNILEYFGKEELTDHLAEFINFGSECLDYNSAEDAELVESFWNQCISNEKLSLQKYREILLSISPIYSEFDIAGIPNDKMDILITENFIPMTEETLVFIRNDYKDCKMQYIINDIFEYADIAIGNLASADEVKQLLSCDIVDDIKIKLLSEIKEKISVLNQNYSNAVMVHILRNNLDESDLPVLYENYREYDPDVQHEILAIAKENIQLITVNPQKVCRDIIYELIKDVTNNKNDRIDLFVAIINGMTSDECKKYLEVLSLNEFVKIFEQNRRPKIPINVVNQKILTALKGAGFVESFVKDEEGKAYKQIRRRSGKTELPAELL